MKYLVISTLDGNDQFEIEAKTFTEALYKALGEVGYMVTESDDEPSSHDDIFEH